jgi:hypothetical protein
MANADGRSSVPGALRAWGLFFPMLIAFSCQVRGRVVEERDPEGVGGGSQPFAGGRAGSIAGTVLGGKPGGGGYPSKLGGAVGCEGGTPDADPGAGAADADLYVAEKPRACTSASAGAPSSGNVMCDATQEGVCQNATDCPFIVDDTARITSRQCGKGCLGKAETCSRDCITMVIDMTSECATCYADTVNCTIKNCVGQCFVDPEADVCKQCQVDKGCRAAFDTCSGLPG